MGRLSALAARISPLRPWRPRGHGRTPHPSCGSGRAGSIVAHNPASLLADVGVSRPQARIPSRLRRHPCRRARRPAALASIGTLGEARPIGGMVLKQLVGVDTDCPPGVRRTLEARQYGTSVSGLTLARASAHQASAGRWTAAGDHAPIVERSIANQQQPHHHHQADLSILPRQPAPRRCRCQEPSDSHDSPRQLAPSNRH